MKPIQIELDKKQVMRIFNQLDDKEKLEIFNKLKKSLFLKRFDQLLETTRTDQITLEEITAEVESVRKNRYEKGKQLP